MDKAEQPEKVTERGTVFDWSWFTPAVQSELARKIVARDKAAEHVVDVARFGSAV